MHIPKCGGQSVANFLLNLPNEHAYIGMNSGHKTADECEKLLEKLYPDVGFKGFAVMRNPYKRFVSAYNFSLWQGKMMMEKRSGKLIRSDRQDNLSWQILGKLDPYNFAKKYGDFLQGKGTIDFVEAIPFAVPAFNPQVTYINQTTELYNLDKNLNKIKKFYSELIGIKINPILKINQSNLTILKYENLDQPTKEMIYEVYYQDFLTSGTEA